MFYCFHNIQRLRIGKFVYREKPESPPVQVAESGEVPNEVKIFFERNRTALDSAVAKAPLEFDEIAATFEDRFEHYEWSAKQKFFQTTRFFDNPVVKRLFALYGSTTLAGKSYLYKQMVRLPHAHSDQIGMLLKDGPLFGKPSFTDLDQPIYEREYLKWQVERERAPEEVKKFLDENAKALARAMQSFNDAFSNAFYGEGPERHDMGRTIEMLYKNAALWKDSAVQALFRCYAETSDAGKEYLTEQLRDASRYVVFGDETVQELFLGSPLGSGQRPPAGKEGIRASRMYKRH